MKKVETLVSHLNEMERKYNDDPKHIELEGIDFAKWEFEGFNKVDDIIEKDSDGSVKSRKARFELTLSMTSNKQDMGYVPRPWYSRKSINGVDGNINSVVIPTEKITIVPPPFAKLASMNDSYKLSSDKVPPAKRYRVYMRNGKYVIQKNTPLKWAYKYGKYVNAGYENGTGGENHGSELYSQFGINDDNDLPVRLSSPADVTSVYDGVDEHNEEFIKIVSEYVRDTVTQEMLDTIMKETDDSYWRTKLAREKYDK